MSEIIPLPQNAGAGLLKPASDNVSVLTVWKKGASAYERLSELALLARTHPERFAKFAFVYIENLPSGNFKYRTCHNSDNLAEVVGLFEIGKTDVLEQVAK